MVGIHSRRLRNRARVSLIRIGARVKDETGVQDRTAQEPLRLTPFVAPLFVIDTLNPILDTLPSPKVDVLELPTA